MEQMRVYLQALGGLASRAGAVDRRETLDDIVDPIVYTEAMDLDQVAPGRGRRHHHLSSGTEMSNRSGSARSQPRDRHPDGSRSGGRHLHRRDPAHAHGKGKSEAMTALAEHDGYDLAESYAYTDSHTDPADARGSGSPGRRQSDSALRDIAEERDWPVVDLKPETMWAQQARDRAMVGCRNGNRRGGASASRGTHGPSGIALVAQQPKPCRTATPLIIARGALPGAPSTSPGRAIKLQSEDLVRPAPYLVGLAPRVPGLFVVRPRPHTFFLLPQAVGGSRCSGTTFIQQSSPTPAPHPNGLADEPDPRRTPSGEPLW